MSSPSSYSTLGSTTRAASEKLPLPNPRFHLIHSTLNRTRYPVCKHFSRLAASHLPEVMADFLAEWTDPPQLPTPADCLSLRVRVRPPQDRGKDDVDPSPAPPPSSHLCETLLILLQLHIVPYIHPQLNRCVGSNADKSLSVVPFCTKCPHVVSPTPIVRRLAVNTCQAVDTAPPPYITNCPVPEYRCLGSNIDLSSDI
ncbi:hypothetical protein Bbelb_434640 [Branchiostoma belcheri]|nr:hypothetical protein Bbelb_434640 [Branchiostoma belcheri]